MNEVDPCFELLWSPPDFTAAGRLLITAMSPLSMVASSPGKFYACTAVPPKSMIYGMLENALGWHWTADQRKDICADLTKHHKKAISDWPKSRCGFLSILQNHVRIGTMQIPKYDYFVDLTRRYVSDTGISAVTNAQNFDVSIRPLMAALSAQRVVGNDLKESLRDENLVTNFKPGDQIHQNIILPYLPLFYTTIAEREYIVPKDSYKINIITSDAMAQHISAAVADPQSPLFLGDNNGLVEVKWQDI